MLGVSMAAGTGKLIAEILSDAPTSIDMSAFTTERFS
jgi:glycine/D-amino acid oxidase-like deaminating enzyme